MKYQGDMALQEPVRSLWTDHDVQQPDRCATDLGRPLATPGGRNTLQEIVADDRALWLATLTAHERDMADKRGSSPDFWLQTGRRYATEYGVTYRFRRVDREEPEYRKLFFDRLNADGSPRGRPVPIHLALEKDGRRVKMVTY